MMKLYSQKHSTRRLIILRIVISILIILTLLGLWEVNPNAALIISGILTLLIILIVESKVQITEDRIIFYDFRLIKFLGSKDVVLFDKIDRIDYYPTKFNIFGVFSHYINAQNNAKLYIFTKEGNVKKHELSYHDKNYNEEIVKQLKKYVKVNMTSS